MIQMQIVCALRKLVPKTQFDNIWFQQDGCLAHSTLDYLSSIFDVRIISNNSV